MDEVKIPKDIMDSIFRIMCGMSSNFSSPNFPVSDHARRGMVHAHKMVMEWGRFNAVDMYPKELKIKKLK